MSEEHVEQLSPQGLARRDAMLDELIIGMHSVHRHRRVRRTMLVASITPALVSVIVAVLWMAHSNSRSPSQQFVRNPNPSAAAIQTSDSVVILRVQTDPSILESWRVREHSSATRLDDDSLLAALADLDHPCGLVSCAGRAWITPPLADSIRQHRDDT